jgi:hypothetical protein
MLGGEDDEDEFLKGLAPPKKDAAGNIASSAIGAGSAAGMGLSASHNYQAPLCSSDQR